MAKVP